MVSTFPQITLPFPCPAQGRQVIVDINCRPLTKLDFTDLCSNYSLSVLWRSNQAIGQLPAEVLSANVQKVDPVFFGHLLAIMQRGGALQSVRWHETKWVWSSKLANMPGTPAPCSPPVRSHASSSTTCSNSSSSYLIRSNLVQQGHAQAAGAQGRGCSATTRGNVPLLKSTPVPAPTSSTRMSTSTTTADCASPIVCHT